MKTPTRVLSHCLARGVAITPNNLRTNLAADQRLGYSGMVIVAALINQRYSPEKISQPFQEIGMSGLVCGLIPGNGPNHFRQPGLVLESLWQQARYAAKLAEKGLGPPVLVGPLHTHHRQPLLDNWSESMLYRWLDLVENLLQEFGLFPLYEPLNGVEDSTPQPFQILYKAVAERNSGLQYDTGHAAARCVLMAEFCRLAPKISYLEFANAGRWPLAEAKGINFSAYAQAMADLPDDCLVGVEPFCPKVIKAFGLEELCDTTFSGEEALAQDAAYLQQLGVMEKP